MKKENLLIELLTEELPPKNLLALSNALAQSIAESLQQAQLIEGSLSLQRYATPRRLAVKIDEVAIAQSPRTLEKKGPAVSASYDPTGKPTPALIGFAASVGVDINSLQKTLDGKREIFVATLHQEGKTLEALLPAILDQALMRLPIAKHMRWRDLSESFVRPVHRLLILHGARVLPYHRFGISADRLTDGHRFLGKQGISITHADHYESQLEREGAVIADFSKRQASIIEQLNRAVLDTPNEKWSASPALIEEVCALTEKPTVIVGHFDPSFLQVPQEALIVSMTQHQKYFPILNDQGALVARFLLVANMPPTAHCPNTIARGNERVLRARLSDAQFFYNTDRQIPLIQRLDSLKQVTYLQALADNQGRGASLYERTLRLGKIAQIVAQPLAINPLELERACQLCKADLVSDLVGEFPELQGIAGNYYARADGESASVATAIGEHYAPKFSGDQLPQSPLGQVLAIADKMETIAGLFGINRPPSGDKDPFGARRAALGVIRMMVELKYPLDMDEVLPSLPQIFAQTAWRTEHEGGATIAKIRSFFNERLRNYLRECGHEISRIEAILALQLSRYDEVLSRLAALDRFMQSQSAQRLIAMGKRIRNILKQNEDAIPAPFSVDLLHEDSERSLAKLFDTLQQTINTHLANRAFDQALAACLPLEAPLAQFFDQVMVLCEDSALRHNRLALLKHLDNLLNQVAVLGELRAS